MVATVNDLALLPPELLGKHSFDEVFYVGLPDAAARAQILRQTTRGLPLQRHEELARLAGGFTGAELVQVVHHALYRLPRLIASHEGDPAYFVRENPLVDALVEEINAFTPLSRQLGRREHTAMLVNMREARLIAIPASAHFHPLPDDTDADVADTGTRW